MRYLKLITASCVLTFLMTFPILVGATTIDFESFSDGDPVINPLPGVTFTNATAITAGITLNEFEFPPRSGNNVVFDDGGPITLDFATSVISVSGYFTYLTSITLTAFDAALNSVAFDTSAFDSNLALSGDAGSLPNEFLGVTYLSGISRIIISGDPAGGSFTLDDLTYTVHSIPEPATLLLLSTSFGMFFFPRRSFCF